MNRLSSLGVAFLLATATGLAQSPTLTITPQDPSTGDQVTFAIDNGSGQAGNPFAVFLATQLSGGETGCWTRGDSSSRPPMGRADSPSPARWTRDSRG